MSLEINSDEIKTEDGRCQYSKKTKDHKNWVSIFSKAKHQKCSPELHKSLLSELNKGLYIGIGTDKAGYAEHILKVCECGNTCKIKNQYKEFSLVKSEENQDPSIIDKERIKQLKETYGLDDKTN